MVFFEDKMHSKICPSGEIDKGPTIRVDGSPKLEEEEEEFEANDNILRPTKSSTLRKNRIGLVTMQISCNGEA